MVIAPVDWEILRSKDMHALQKQYLDKFQERFIGFNYADFPGTETKLSAEQYMEALKEALEKDEPTRIESHRYDDFDH